MINKTEYSKIHIWLAKTYGKANFCENIACRKTSTSYAWAKLKNKEYDYKRDNFIQLCKQCHSQYDFKEGRFDKNENDHPVTAIRVLRLKLGLDQSEFASEIGVTTSTVCNWERKRRSPRFPKIRKMIELAKRYKIKMTVEDFLS